MKLTRKQAIERFGVYYHARLRSITQSATVVECLGPKPKEGLGEFFDRYEGAQQRAVDFCYRYYSFAELADSIEFPEPVDAGQTVYVVFRNRWDETYRSVKTTIDTVEPERIRKGDDYLRSKIQWGCVIKEGEIADHRVHFKILPNTDISEGIGVDHDFGQVRGLKIFLTAEDALAYTRKLKSEVSQHFNVVTGSIDDIATELTALSSEPVLAP